MFETTRVAARAAAIDATICADNAAGLRYYASMGFSDWERLRAVPLLDSVPAGRIRKRFHLT